MNRYTHVVVNDKPGKKYQTTWSLVFSPDGRRFAHTAEVYKNKKRLQTVVVDGKEGKTYDNIGMTPHRMNEYGGPVFSPDGSRVAYEAKSGAQAFMVVDGKEEGPYTSVGRPVFSPNSKRLAYTARSKGKSYVVVDGKKYGPCTWPDKPLFSPDSRRVAWVAGEPDSYVVIDGKKHANARAPIFSPDGQGVAYVGMAKDRQCVLHNGKRGKLYDRILDLTFSPDGKRLGYVAAKLPPDHAKSRPAIGLVDTRVRYKVVLVVDGRESEEFDRIVWGPVFGPDGKRVAYATKQGKVAFAVIDGRKLRAHDDVSRIIFGPKGRRVAYVANRGKKSFVVVDGKGAAEYDSVHPATLCFSPDARRVAYVANKSNSRIVVIDTTEGRPYDPFGVQEEIHSFETGPHTRTIIFRYPGPKIIFDSPDAFHYLARKGRNIYLVKENMTSKSE
ncbi:MAG: hypothetical protein QGH60_17595 [Phycisphaerae bacterium]|jgi:hypothetical protein|nr:hypothetical protein [Phycisphaerae bacterium]